MRINGTNCFAVTIQSNSFKLNLLSRTGKQKQYTDENTAL